MLPAHPSSPAEVKRCFKNFRQRSKHYPYVSDSLPTISEEPQPAIFQELQLMPPDMGSFFGATGLGSPRFLPAASLPMLYSTGSTHEDTSLAYEGLQQEGGENLAEDAGSALIEALTEGVCVEMLGEQGNFPCYATAQTKTPKRVCQLLDVRCNPMDSAQEMEQTWQTESCKGKETKESTELASSSAHQEDISQITVLAAVSIVQPEIVLQNSTQEIASVDLQPETAERQLGNNNLQEKALPGHQKSASKVQQLRLKLTAYRQLKAQTRKEGESSGPAQHKPQLDISLAKAHENAMGLASAEVAKTVKDKRQEALTLPAALVEQTQMMPLPKNKHDCVADREELESDSHSDQAAWGSESDCAEDQAVPQQEDLDTSEGKKAPHRNQVLDVETFDGQHRKDNASGTAAEQSKNSPPDSSLTVKLYSAKKGYYEGQCLEGIPHGCGYQRKAKTEHYFGAFENGRRHGLGVLRRAEGVSYHGTFADGCQSGNGILETGTGESLQGEFLQGSVHGWGVRFFSDGTEAAGRWTRNKLEWSRVISNEADLRSLSDLDRQGVEVALDSAYLARYKATEAIHTEQRVKKSLKLGT